MNGTVFKALLVFTLACFFHAALCAPVSAGDSIAVQDAGSRLYGTIEVKLADTQGDPETFMPLIRSLIVCRENRMYDPEDVEKSKARLQKTGLFSAVEAQTVLAADRADCTFFLTPGLILKNIVIKGEFPFFESEIRRILTIHEGSVLHREKMETQREIVRRFLTANGYADPQITISVEADRVQGFCSATIQIVKKPYTRLSNITFSGNRSFRAFRLERKMKSLLYGSVFLRNSRFVEESMNKGVQELMAFYRTKGFADCRVSYSLRRDTAKNSVAVDVTVSEGPRYIVKFDKKDSIRRRKLREDVVLFREGNRNNIGIKKSIKNMRSRYDANGYYDARFAVRDTLVSAAQKGVRFITFSIDAGLRPVIDKIVIQGNTVFADAKIDQQMRLSRNRPFRPGIYSKNILEKDILAVRTLYNNFGYYGVQIDTGVSLDSQTSRITVYLNITEGRKTVVDSLKIAGAAAVPAEDILKILAAKKGAPLIRHEIDNDKNRIAALYSDRGYPYVQVAHEIIITSDSTAAAVIFSITEGAQVRMGEIVYRGNFKTKKRVLDKNINITTGDEFSLSKILKGQKNFRNMLIFNSVQYTPVGIDDKQDTVHMIVEIEERKPLFLQASLGYASDTRFYGKVSAGDRNLFGLNRNLIMSSTISRILKAGKLRYINPSVWGSPFAATNDLFAERVDELYQDYSLFSWGVSTGLTRDVAEKLVLKGNIIYNWRDRFNGPDSVPAVSDSASGETWQPRNILQLSLAMTFDTRNSFARPRKGGMATMDFDVYKGIDNAFDDFFKYHLDGRWYVSPVKKLTCAVRTQAWYILPFGRYDSIPRDQQISLGGPENVRGYRTGLLFYSTAGTDFLSQAGYAALCGNIEARFNAFSNFEFTLFYDFGGLGNDLSADQWLGFRSAAGGGLSYLTPIGPVGFLYGFKIDPDKQESLGEFHFSIGYSF